MKIADLQIGNTFRIRKNGLEYKVIDIQGLAEARHCISTTKVVTRGGFRSNYRNKIFRKEENIFEKTN